MTRRDDAHTLLNPNVFTTAGVDFTSKSVTRLTVNTTAIDEPNGRRIIHVLDFVQFVDMHCHLLPGIDDGARNWDEALAMARLAEADGIQTVIATPHQLGTYRTNDGRTVRARTAHLQEFLNQRDVNLRLLPGAEARIEPDLAGRIRAGEILTLADRGRYVLLEMPHEVCLPIGGLLGELNRAGVTGVLAHVERNMRIMAQPSLAKSFVAAGCLLQVTAGSILGTFGKQTEETALRLIRQGMVHFVATDAHGAKSRRPLMRRAFERLVEIVGHEAAAALCCGNPAALLDDGHIELGLGRPEKTVLRSWFGWKKAS